MNSWVNPAKRAMPVLNVAWGNVSLCRSVLPDHEDEVYIGSCASMKQLRKITQNDVDLRNILVSSVQPCKDLLMKRALQMEYTDCPIKEAQCATEAEISHFFRHILQIDPGMQKLASPSCICDTVYFST